MEIRKPIWELAGDRCPCCNGQGELIFSVCPNCNRVVLICAERGTAFEISGAKRGKEIGCSYELMEKCVFCKMAKYSDFRDATSNEIQELGFLPGEYQ